MPVTREDVERALRPLSNGIDRLSQVLEHEVATPINDQALVLKMASNSQLAQHFTAAAGQTTDSILTATRVFGDPQANDYEKASATLKCLSGATMLISLAGAPGLIAGTTLSVLISVTTFALDLNARHRKTELEKVEELLRNLGAEEARADINAASSMLFSQQGVLQKMADHSKTWNELMPTVPLTSDMTRFKMAATGEWLKNPKNRNLEHWDEVFEGYAYAATQEIELLTTFLTKLEDEQSVDQLLGFLKTYGDQMKLFEEVQENVDDLGDLWHTTSREGLGMYVKNPFNPSREWGGWSDCKIGRSHAFYVSPRNGRVWSQDGDNRLATGKSDAMHSFNSTQSPANVIDLCLVPWAGVDTDLLLLTATEPDGSKGKLWVNEWHENRNRFFTKDELERTPPVTGFETNFWTPNLALTLPDFTVVNEIVMARAFRGLPAPSVNYDDFVYLVVKASSRLDGQWRQGYALLYALLDDVRQRDGREVSLRQASIFTNEPFRITVSKRYLYLYTSCAAWRQKHNDLLLGKGVWQKVDLPAERNWSKDGKDLSWEPATRRWWSSGLNDLYAWSDDDVVGVGAGVGELWTGHFDSPERRRWTSFGLDLRPSLTNVNDLPQGGKALIVVANVGNTLHFRVFEAAAPGVPDGKMVVDTDETKLNDKDQVERIADLKKDLGTWPANPTSEQKLRLIEKVTDLVGGGWKWKQIYGGARTFTKVKSESWNYCRELSEIAANLRAGGGLRALSARV